MGEPSIESAKTKLLRADQHLKMLDLKWGAYQQTEPNAITHEYRGETKEWKMYFSVEKPLPPDLSAILGDALTNLRACLDHLVAYFVERNEGTVDTNHAFPICRSEQEFISRVELARRKRDRGGPLRGIPSDSPEWTIVKDAQPYHRADPREHPLAVLNEMVNIDKHRELHPAATHFEVGGVFDLFDIQQGEVIYAVPHWGPGQPLKDRTHLATLTFAEHPVMPSWNPSDIVKVKNPVSTTVMFGDHDPERPHGSFSDVADFVAEIISKAEVLIG